jgi:hypothetical protein
MELLRQGELDAAVMAFLPNLGMMTNPHAVAQARKDEIGNIVVELKNHAEQLILSLTYTWNFKGK